MREICIGATVKKVGKTSVVFDNAEDNRLTGTKTIVVYNRWIGYDLDKLVPGCKMDIYYTTLHSVGFKIAFPHRPK